jgi:sugar phosphate permease
MSKMPGDRVLSTRVRIVSAIWFLALVNYLDRVAISFAGPSIMGALGMSPATFGVVLSSFGIGYILGLIPGGLIADKWGARPVLIFTPLLWAAFTGMTGLVMTLASFILVRVGLGISEGLFSPSTYKVIGEHFDAKQRAGVVAIVFSALALGPALAGPLVGALIAAHGWQVMFALMTIPAILASLGAYFLVPAMRAPALAQVAVSAEDQVPFRQVLRRPSLWLLATSNLCTDIAQWGFMGWMPSYLAMARGIDLKTSGHLGGIPFVFAFFGLMLGGWLGTTFFHRYRAQLVLIFYLAAGLSLFLAYRAGSVTMAVAGLSGAAFFMYGALAPKGALVIGLAPDRSRAAYVGVYNTAGQIGGAAAPAIIGFMVSATGAFAMGFGFMIVALCIAAICMALLIPHVSFKTEPALAAS